MLRLILISLAVAGVAYFLTRSPMEEASITKNPYKMRAAVYGFKFAGNIADLLSFLGLVSWQNSMRIAEYLTPSVSQSDEVKVREESFDGVRVLVYDPVIKEGDKVPAIVFIHGGGFVLMTADMYHSFTMELAKTLKYIVISIDYRRAPEHPYPVPFQDCVKATLHFLRHAAKYGVNPGRVAIAGDSAGGNLATTVSLYLHSEPTLPKLKLQLLIYPTVQFLDFDTPSWRKYADYGILPRAFALKLFLLYVRGEAVLSQLNELVEHMAANNHVTLTSLTKVQDRVNWGRRLAESDRDNRNTSKFGSGHPDLAPHFTQAVQDPYLSPLTGASDESLRRLPPVYLVTCKRDVLRDDGLMYKSRLEEVGVRVYYQEYDSIHALFSLPGVLQEAETAIDNLISFILKNDVL